MLHRTASLLSSLAVAVLALTLAASFWRTSAREVAPHHAPTIDSSAPPSCWTPPEAHSERERECIA
jgi:hypothetical protein